MDKLIKDNLNENYLLEGIPGLAKCIADNNTDSNGLPTFLISDSSRKIIRYRDDTNKEVKDQGVTELVKRIKNPVKEKATKITNELLQSFCLKTKTPELAKIVESQISKTTDLKNLSQNADKFAFELSKRLPN